MIGPGPRWSAFHILGIVSMLPLLAPSAAAESSSALTCKAARLPDGFFKYELSEGPHSPNCEICWEDRNKIVIARGSSFNTELAQNLTSQFITLKDCYSYMRYTRDCSGDFDEAHCRVNCSVLLDPHPPTVNSTLTCFIKSWCPDLLTVGLVLGIPGFLLLAAGVFGSLFIRKFISNRRRSTYETASYSRATQQDKTEQQRDVVV